MLFCMALQESAGEAAGASSLPWFVALAAALLAGAALLRARGRPVRRADRPGSFAGPGELARAELERLVVEIQDLSREHIARLDGKIRILTQLLSECDRKKRELEALLGLRAAPDPSSGGFPTESPAPVSRPPNPLHEQVYSLQDAGKDLQEICNATGLEKGEVELILGLRQVPPVGRRP
ncbi:MAG: hypothetical protein ACK44W_13315, partial [Planctomycetota bacterium]